MIRKFWTPFAKYSDAALLKMALHRYSSIRSGAAQELARRGVKAVTK